MKSSYYFVKKSLEVDVHGRRKLAHHELKWEIPAHIAKEVAVKTWIKVLSWYTIMYMTLNTFALVLMVGKTVGYTALGL